MKTIILLLLTLTLYAETSWEDNIPAASNFDWVQTASGEWLKGEIKGMYDGELEFDSDEFGIQNIDWDDVKKLISKATTSLYIEDRGIITGQLYVHDEYIYLTTKDETLKLERSEIISMTNGKEEESSYWSGKFSVGFSVSEGNTQKVELTTTLYIKRQTANTRFLFNNLGNYTETFGETTEDNQRLTSSLDIFQTRNFFWRPAFLEYNQDFFQNIEHKYTVGLGLGYDLISNSKSTLTLFVGPAYQSTTFDNVEAGEENPVTTPVFLFTTNYDVELTNNLDFKFKYQGYFVNDKSGEYVHHALATLETELIDDFTFDYTIIWDRVNIPTKEADGTLPLQDDYKSILSVAYSF